MLKAFGTVFSVFIVAASVAHAAPKMSVILTCEGDPSIVIASQSSATAPVVPLGADCAQAVSDVVSTPLTDINATWQVTPLIPEKGQTTYSIVETVKGLAGPPGPEGPPGPDGTSVIDLTKIYRKSCFGCTAVACDNAADKVVGGGVQCASPGFTKVSTTQPAFSTSVSPPLPCSGGSFCEAWYGLCEGSAAGAFGNPSLVAVICIRP